jgi:2-polyprenyl-3-methyl-5-hydroxy-6-metoxy-1,4-benzoquinol methylase
VCDATTFSVIADQEVMRSETETLWEFHERRLRGSVPPKYLLDRVVFSQHPPVQLVQCKQCTHVYRNPRERATALSAAYEDETLDDAVAHALFETQRVAYREQARRLTRVFGRVGRGLEVGSYVGGFLAAAREAGWVFEGVDLNAAAAAFAEQTRFSVTCGTIDMVPAVPPFDVVAVWNTFEQLYDSRAAAAAARNRVREGGMLVVRVPNGSFYTEWRERLAGKHKAMATVVLAHNNLLSFPYRQGYTADSLGRLLSSAGFRVVHVHGDTLVPISDRWTTRYGAAEEWVTKRMLKWMRRGWRAPWVEVYARAV